MKPPYCAYFVMWRVRDVWPPPHVLEHVVQSVQLLTVQWMAHGPALQVRASFFGGHGLPPWAALRATVR